MSTRVGNQGPRFLAYLQERGRTRRGWIEQDVIGMVRDTGIDTHDLTKMLRGWQKLNLVKFTTHRKGTVDTFSGIRLTPTGMTYQFPEARRMTTDTALAETPTETTTAEPIASIGRDSHDEQLDGAKHRKRAYRPALTPEVLARMQALRNGPPRRTVTQVASLVGVSVQSVVRHTTAPEEPLPGSEAVDLSDLPLIASLRGRPERLLAAAAAIESDAPDLAAGILARAEDFTPLEREVLTLLSRIKTS